MGAEAIPAELRDLLGHTIADGYRLDEIIGSGGMGVVFGAEQIKLRRSVAVKILDPAVADAARERRFKREAESVARLDHVNCLQVFDYGTTPDGLHYMVMPRLQGSTLSRILRDENLSPRRAMQLVVQILAGLEHAHGQGLIHRDLKPANIFLVDGDDAGEQTVKIVDFGIAKIIDNDADSSFQTRAGVMFGTPAYMSPEQAVGETVDARSDLYALGIVLYRMIAGSVPHRGKTVIDQMRKRATLDIPALPSPVPAEVSEFMQWLCERDVENRCPDAGKARRRAQKILAAAPAKSAGWDEALPDIAVMTPGDHTVLDRSVSVTRLDAYLRDASGPSATRMPATRDEPAPPGDTLFDPQLQEDIAAAQAPAPEGAEEASTRVTAAPRDESATGSVSAPSSVEHAPSGSGRWLWMGGVGVVLVAVVVALWPRDDASAPAPGAAQRAVAPPEANPQPPAEPPVEEAETTGDELVGDESPPPIPTVAESELLEKLTRVNTRKADAVLAYAERHAILEQLRADPRAAALVDEEANAVWDLSQASDAPQPCATFSAALDRIEGSADRWVRRALRRAELPDSEEPACRVARRKLDQLQSAGKVAEPEPAPTVEPAPEKKPKAGEVTEKLGGLK